MSFVETHGCRGQPNTVNSTDWTTDVRVARSQYVRSFVLRDGEYVGGRGRVDYHETMAWHGYRTANFQLPTVERPGLRTRDRPAWTHLTGARTLIRKNQKEEKKERDAIKIKFVTCRRRARNPTAKGS